MRAEEDLRADNVIAFRRPQRAAETTADCDKMPSSGQEAETPTAMVLNAERGIINTGIVHGGQHATVVELSSHFDDGAESDV